MSIHVRPFRDSDAAAWDALVESSRNGTFLVKRPYMTYHSARYVDSSLVLEDGGRLVAVLPANRAGDHVGVHDGLTFAGLVASDGCRASVTLAAFDALVDYLRKEGIRKLRYKPAPHIYHRVPNEEDLYALFRLGATLARRDVSASLAPAACPGVSKGRRWALKKAQENGLAVREATDWVTFMCIERNHLREKHGAVPTHTADEMALLAARFPQNIRCFVAYKSDRMLGGTIIYESAKVAHAQYIAATPEGWELGAVDAVLDEVIFRCYPTKPWFDFGISTESGGTVLNGGLAQYKESWGARSIMYDQYVLSL
jgi:hypothetical protein